MCVYRGTWVGTCVMGVWEGVCVYLGFMLSVRIPVEYANW